MILTPFKTDRARDRLLSDLLLPSLRQPSLVNRSSSNVRLLAPNVSTNTTDMIDSSHSIYNGSSLSNTTPNESAGDVSVMSFKTSVELTEDRFTVVSITTTSTDWRRQSDRGDDVVYDASTGDESVAHINTTNCAQWHDVSHIMSSPPIHPAEIILIILLLAFWASTIAVFLRKWRSIRILQPGEPRFKHAPKNLETIKVVSRHRDSVIYHNYSDNITKTMQARQKRLDRMNTMPNIKLGEIIPLSNLSLIGDARRGSCDVEKTCQFSFSPVTGRDTREAWPDGAHGSVQPSTSTALAVANFHSNALISPVMEVEESDDCEDTIERRKS